MAKHRSHSIEFKRQFVQAVSGLTSCPKNGQQDR